VISRQDTGRVVHPSTFSDARSVADRLEIPFYVIECEAKFQSYVIDNFVHEYLEGRTPTPVLTAIHFLNSINLFVKMKELGCELFSDRSLCSRIETEKKARAFN